MGEILSRDSHRSLGEYDFSVEHRVLLAFFLVTDVSHWTEESDLYWFLS